MALFVEWMVEKLNENPDSPTTMRPADQYYRVGNTDLQKTTIHPTAVGGQNQDFQLNVDQNTLNTLYGYSNKINNNYWHLLFDIFSRWYQKYPTNPQAKQLGQALTQSAQTGNMKLLDSWMKMMFRGYQPAA